MVLDVKSGVAVLHSSPFKVRIAERPLAYDSSSLSDGNAVALNGFSLSIVRNPIILRVGLRVGIDYKTCGQPAVSWPALVIVCRRMVSLW